MNTPQRRIAHRYEVSKSLGMGALGQVFLAWDPVLAREVTIKTLRQDLNLSPETLRQLGERLKREARNNAALVHPAAVPLHDMGDDPELGVYLVFPFVDGPTLRAVLAKGPLTIEQVAEVALTLGDLLSSAHEAGVLHRSIRPENIFMGRHGLLVTDFGLSRLTDEPTEGIAMPPSPYLSPEVEARGVFTARNDQFAMAVLLRELLSGKTDPGPIALPEGEERREAILNKLIARGAAPRAEDRFGSCREFGEKVHAVLAASQGERVSAPVSMRMSLGTSVPPPPVADIAAAEEQRKSTRRAQNVLGAAGILVLLVLLFLGHKSRTQVESLEAGTTATAAVPSPPTAERPKATPTAPHAKPAKAAPSPDAGLPDAE